MIDVFLGYRRFQRRGLHGDGGGLWKETRRETRRGWWCAQSTFHHSRSNLRCVPNHLNRSHRNSHYKKDWVQYRSSRRRHGNWRSHPYIRYEGRSPNNLLPRYTASNCLYRRLLAKRSHHYKSHNLLCNHYTRWIHVYNRPLTPHTHYAEYRQIHRRHNEWYGWVNGLVEESFQWAKLKERM